jgi:hypothetical protein
VDCGVRGLRPKWPWNVTSTSIYDEGKKEFDQIKS